MKTFRSSTVTFFGSMALFLASCSGVGGLFGGQNGNGDGGLDMGVAMQGLKDDQSFCFSWTLYQEDKEKKGWKIIDQRDDEICSEPGEDHLSDFATCYDGKHFLVSYDVTVRDEKGDVIGQATATSGGGPKDVCVKNTDVNSTATIQFNNEGKAGGVNPGIDVDQVCSNDKVQKEDDDIVSALWLQPDSCDKSKGTPDSFCSLACGEEIETQRYDITQDGKTRFIFNSAPVGADWDIVYLPFPADEDLSSLHLINAPFALHHFADGSNYGREELSNTVGSFRLGSTVGVIFQEGDKLIVKFDKTANCDGPIDRDAKIQVIKLPPCKDGCEPIGVVATGGSNFDVILSCDGDLVNIGCDADLSGDKKEVCDAD